MTEQEQESVRRLARQISIESYNEGILTAAKMVRALGDGVGKEYPADGALLNRVAEMVEGATRRPAEPS